MGQFNHFNVSFSLWYIKHRRVIDFITIVILAVVNFVIGIYIFALAVEYWKTPSPGEPAVLIDPTKDLEAIKILRVEAVQDGNFYDLVAQIENPNNKYGLGELDYRFILLDSNKETIGEAEGTSYILPGQTKYIIRTKVNSLGEIMEARLELSPGTWLKKRRIEEPDMAVLPESKKLDLNPAGRLELFAIAKNYSYYHFKTVDINVVCLDADNAILGVNHTTLNNFEAQTRREFRLRWNQDFRSQLSDLIIDLNTNTYNPDNFIKAGDDNDEPSEYRDI